MTTRYVGAGGSDAADGLSWANRKLTLNGVEDTPVVAGDLVHVGPGTYRELLTVDVSGTAGNPIEYRGDYTGANTDGVGGIVRVTGSDNDQTATRAQCVTATTKNYRTFTGFQFDTTTAFMVYPSTGCTNWIIQQCAFAGATGPINFTGLAQSTHTIQNCLFLNTTAAQPAIYFSHSAVVDNAGHTVQNCLFLGRQIASTRVGGITIKNCVFAGCNRGVQVDTALTIGQVVTINNCIFTGIPVALQATAVGEIVEDYNTFYGNSTDRTNVNVGANSVTYPPLFDPRWFMQLVHAGAGPNNTQQLVTPLDLASFSQLVNVAGTSPTTTDMRGTAVQGAQREWGALEYDSTLAITAMAFILGLFAKMANWAGYRM